MRGYCFNCGEKGHRAVDCQNDTSNASLSSDVPARANKRRRVDHDTGATTPKVKRGPAPRKGTLEYYDYMIDKLEKEYQEADDALLVFTQNKRAEKVKLMRRIAGFKVDRNRLEDEKVEIEKEMEQVLAMARARLAQEKTKAASTKPTLSDRSTDGALAAVTDPGLFGSYTEETKAAPITADPIKLEETKLEETKLEETKLEETKLEETKLEETKLEEVKLEEIKIKVEEY